MKRFQVYNIKIAFSKRFSWLQDGKNTFLKRFHVYEIKKDVFEAFLCLHDKKYVFEEYFVLKRWKNTFFKHWYVYKTKKHVFEAFSGLQNEKHVFEAFSGLQNEKHVFETLFIFTAWKQHVFWGFSCFKDEKHVFWSVFMFATWKNSFSKRFSYLKNEEIHQHGSTFWSVFDVYKMKRNKFWSAFFHDYKMKMYVFEAFSNYQNEKTRFTSILTSPRLFRNGKLQNSNQEESDGKKEHWDFVKNIWISRWNFFYRI